MTDSERFSDGNLVPSDPMDVVSGDPHTGDAARHDDGHSDDTYPGDPGNTHADPGGHLGDPHTGDPNTGDPKTGDTNSGDPNTGDPNTGDPQPYFGDPNAGDPQPHFGDPNAGDPQPHLGDPNTGDPQPHLGDPNTGDPQPPLGDSSNGDADALDTGYDPEPLRAGPFRVLFDNSLSETAANADWVIDNDWPTPYPANPTLPTDWTGAYSSWGFDLWATGRYQVETLGPGGALTYDDLTNTQDLSLFDMLVLPEPNNPLSATAKEAILTFVEAGGGLFMISGHSGADRDNDGWDAIDVLADLMNNNNRASNIFGISYNRANFTDYLVNTLATLPQSRVLHGPFGEVTGISIHGGTSMTIDLAHPGVRGLIWRTGYPNDPRYANVASSKYGAGRVFALGDSSPGDDGTANPGNANIFDSWTELGVTNNLLILNASAWLVRDRGY